MIKIIDYGVGNVQAFLVLLKRLNIQAECAKSPNDLINATKLILPGVGHFDYAMNKLNNSGMRDSLDQCVLENKVPILGVCVGMQMLGSNSEEGSEDGLNWIPGKVRSFKNIENFSLPLPHMGWNHVEPENNSVLFTKGFNEKPQFYFLHSYYFDVQDKKNISAKSKYGVDFEVAISSGNIHGVQCHPEKSHHWGLNLINNFSTL